MARRFTLLDDVYYETLLRVVEALTRESLEFCLVGGGAAQAWIASLWTAGGQRRLSDEPVLRTALRRTRDLDFATLADAADMLRILNTLAEAGPDAAQVLGPRALRLGPVSVSFTLGPEDLSGMSDRYNAFLNSRTALALRRGKHTDEVPAIGIEALLVTKLTRRGDKAKDIVDLTQILAALGASGRIVRLEEVRRAVKDQPEALDLLSQFAHELGQGDT